MPAGKSFLGPFDPDLDERIQAILDTLGLLPATSQRHPGTSKHGPSDHLLATWIADPNSHLLVVSGSYGSGKSYLLNRVVRQKQPELVFDYSIEDIPAPAEESKGKLIFIDHFDEISGYSGLQKKAPDLRLVLRHLRQMKVCIVTNRPLTDKGHELVRQLRYRARLDALGVRNLELLTLETWSTQTVQAAIDANLPAASRHFANIANALAQDDMSNLLRPMVLRMLLTIISRQPDDWIPEYGEIYEHYLEHALSWDYDQGRSQISSMDKRATLQELAYSVFSGKDMPIRNERRSTLIAVGTIAEKLRLIRGGSQFSDQEFINDFLLTNRCLVPISSSSEIASSDYRFGSMTIFEYFLAHAFVDRFCDATGVGITDDRFNAAILDTRMLYFARRAIAQVNLEPIIDLVRDESLGNIDRLILLYLLEDWSGFIELLSAAPEPYFAYLVDVGQRNNWHFMAKIARFQLVSAGRMSASEYIDYVQLSEEPAHLDVELQLCRSPTGNIAYLESRFRNANLRNSAAISIYRITQIDPLRAKTLLEEQDFLSSVQLRECLDACTRALESNARRFKPSI